MTERNETLADIVAEMWNGPIPRHRRDEELLRIYAARIEAAGKREREMLDANLARVRELEGLLGGAADALLGAAIRRRRQNGDAQEDKKA